MLFLLQYIRPHRKLLVLTLLLTTTNQFFSLMDPQVLRWLMDNYLTNPGTHTTEGFINGLLLGLGGLIGVAMISRIAKNFQDYFVNVMTQKIGTEIYQKTIAHTFLLPYARFEDQQSGQLLQKLIKAKESIQTYIASLISVVFLALVGVIIVVGYSFMVDRRIGVLYLLLMPIIGITTMKLSQKIKQAQTSIAVQSNSLAGSITESLRNVSLIKMLGLVGQELTRIDRANLKILDLEVEKVKKVRTMEFIQGTLINAMRVALIGFLGYLVYTGAITVGELLSLYFYSFFLFGQLSQFGLVTKHYQEAKANHEMLNDILSQQPEAPDDHKEHITTLHTIRCENISFGYEAQQTTLHNVSCTMCAGETVAFVGPSGSGKSTMLKLLAGLYTPNKGTIYFNDLPVDQVALSRLKKTIGIVTQDAQLFSGTIRDNLLFVAPDASDTEIMTVLGQSSLQSFLDELPDGIETMIGEGGLKLSGGQKQRLAIARSLLRNPQLLIFDEATSSLDSLVEKEIAETIKSISSTRPDMITIIVAHRLSTVMHADTIYVLEKGSIIESGTHSALLTNRGLYAAMRRQQIGEE